MCVESQFFHKTAVCLKKRIATLILAVRAIGFLLTPANSSVVQEFECINWPCDTSTAILGNSQINQFYGSQQFVAPQFHGLGWERGYSQDILSTSSVLKKSVSEPSDTWNTHAIDCRMYYMQLVTVNAYCWPCIGNRTSACNRKNPNAELTITNSCGGRNDVRVIEHHLRPDAQHIVPPKGRNFIGGCGSVHLAGVPHNYGLLGLVDSIPVRHQVFPGQILIEVNSGVSKDSTIRLKCSDLAGPIINRGAGQVALDRSATVSGDDKLILRELKNNDGSGLDLGLCRIDNQTKRAKATKFSWNPQKWKQCGRQCDTRQRNTMLRLHSDYFH